ncbi:MAG: hypothetical protein AAGD07_10395 [Planctomycetota bacterium]
MKWKRCRVTKRARSLAKHSVLSLVAILPSLTCGEDSHARLAVPIGIGQLESAPTLFRGGVDDRGRHYFLNGQRALNGKLILTASNGFFDNGTCVASGQSALPKVGDADLIQPNFAVLERWQSTQGTLRWHVWLPEPGVVRLSVNMRVTERQAGSRLTISLGKQSHTVTTVSASAENAQPWELAFEIQEPGEHTITVKANLIEQPDTGVGALHTVDVFGSAVANAQLLRARWRPAAVHGRYSCSAIKQSRTWVMSTRSTCEFSSYSPITTPFGYFGTSFEADGRSKGVFNFSMWAAGKGKGVPALAEMPHLLAAGSRDATFSGFGHEGSGVKLRDWIAMPHRPRECVQALRVETQGDYDTYFGYFWDHPTERWRLYAVGRKWNGGKGIENLSPGSFCEVPGPPHVQRSGDRVREVRRRGWHLGDDDHWYPMDTFYFRSKAASNKYWLTEPGGEFVMGTGGMRYFETPALPPTRRVPTALPVFLSPNVTKQLNRLPAKIREIVSANISSETARIRLTMSRAGTNARVQIHYGVTDCLTFAKRKLHATERHSIVSQSTQADDRAWENCTQAFPLRDGKNEFTLSGLQPGTAYFYRVLITNDQGKLWSFSTERFNTKPQS